MIKEFDLFKLHVPEEDIKPRSWVRASGKNLTKKLRKLTSNKIQERYSINSIATIISKDIKVKKNTICSQLYNFLNSNYIKRKNFISLQIINSLIKNFYPEDYDELKWQLIKSIEYMTTGCPKSNPTYAPKRLSNEFSELAGAHAADGTLVRYATSNKGFQYRLWISDKDKGSLEYIKKIIKNLFDLNVEVNKCKYDNSYQIILDNKVVVRYLNKFLGFKYGNKTETVDAPKIIKANQTYSRAFLRGFLSFDGCVDYYGYVRISIKNKNIIEYLKKTLNKDGIHTNYNEENTRKGVFSLRTNIENKSKLLDYFIKESNKWSRLNFFLNKEKDKELDILFQKEKIGKFAITDILKKSKKLNLFTYNMIKKHFDISARSLRAHLRILENAQIIEKIDKSNQNYQMLRSEIAAKQPIKNSIHIYNYNGK